MVRRWRQRHCRGRHRDHWTASQGWRRRRCRWRRRRRPRKYWRWKRRPAPRRSMPAHDGAAMLWRRRRRRLQRWDWTVCVESQVHLDDDKPSKSPLEHLSKLPFPGLCGRRDAFHDYWGSLPRPPAARHLSSGLTHRRLGKRRQFPRSRSHCHWATRSERLSATAGLFLENQSENATENTSNTVRDVFAQRTLHDAHSQGPCLMRVTRVTSCRAEDGIEARPLRGQCRSTGCKSQEPSRRREKNGLACGQRGSESTPGCRGASAPASGRCSSVTTPEGPPSHHDDLPIHWVTEGHRQFMPTTEKKSVDL